MNRRTTWICCGLACGLLAGCATPGGGTDPDYVPGSSYHQIMGEIAADRGVTATAAEEFLQAAERSDDPQFSQRAAEFAFANGFDAYALRSARRWAQLDPSDASAHLYLSRLLLRRNDVAGAAAEAERALGPAAVRVDEDYELLVNELGEEGNAEGLIRVLTRIAATALESLPLRLAIAQAALRSQDLDLAAESARAAIAAGAAETDLDEANLVIGRVLLARDDADAAIAHLERQVEARPSLDMELEYVSILAAADRPEAALERLDRIADRYGREPEVRRLRALISFNTGDVKTAWEEFNSLLDDDDYADESRFHVAQLAGREARFDQALRLLGRIGDGPYLLPAQEAIARVAEASNDSESALKILGVMADRHPERAFDVARVRAATLQRLGRNEEALAVFNEILRYRPDDAEVLMSRGALLEKMDQLDAALADMTAAQSLYPDSPVAANALGYTLANRTGRQRQAYRLVRLALEREPGSAAILDSYGWVLFRQRRLAEARSYLQLAYSQFPDPEVAAHLGEVMWNQGEREAARKLWAEALEKSPASQPLIDTMIRFPK